MKMLSSHTSAGSPWLWTLLLKLKYAYDTFSGLLFAAKTIPIDKSTWTLNVQDGESPYLFPNLINWSEKKHRWDVE